MAAVRQGFTSSFVNELTKGVHDLSADTLKLALYDDDVTLGVATTAYSATNEISGTGYSAGGVTVAISSGYPLVTSDGFTDYRFDAAEWTTASFSARAGLLYNSSQSNKSILVFDFGVLRTVVSGTFTISFPTFMPALIRQSFG